MMTYEATKPIRNIHMPKSATVSNDYASKHVIASPH